MLEQPSPPQPVHRKPWFWLAIGCSVLLVVCCVAGVIRGATDADSAATTAEQRTSSEPDVDGTTPAEEEIADVEIEIPSVIDKNAAVAKDELERLGFTDVQFGSVDPDNDTLGVVNPANWTVVEQSHKPGETVFADATIVLGCVKNS